MLEKYSCCKPVFTAEDTTRPSTHFTPHQQDTLSELASFAATTANATFEENPTFDLKELVENWGNDNTDTSEKDESMDWSELEKSLGFDINTPPIPESYPSKISKDLAVLIDKLREQFKDQDKSELLQFIPLIRSLIDDITNTPNTPISSRPEYNSDEALVNLILTGQVGDVVNQSPSLLKKKKIDKTRLTHLIKENTDSDIINWKKVITLFNTETYGSYTKKDLKACWRKITYSHNNPVKPPKTPWNKEEIQKLRELYIQHGPKFRLNGRELHRSENAVRQKIQKFRIK